MMERDGFDNGLADYMEYMSEFNCYEAYFHGFKLDTALLRHFLKCARGFKVVVFDGCYLKLDSDESLSFDDYEYEIARILIFGCKIEYPGEFDLEILDSGDRFETSSLIRKMNDHIKKSSGLAKGLERIHIQNNNNLLSNEDKILKDDDSQLFTFSMERNGPLDGSAEKVNDSNLVQVFSELASEVGRWILTGKQGTLH